MKILILQKKKWNIFIKIYSNYDDDEVGEVNDGYDFD